ncbi:MAG: hypothetical protein OES13_01150 [Acidimicrobiia bacterium]|nr:hypothetical protein [Acidimicrobiia bacterium]
MRGIGYLIVEIVLLLIASGVIGYLVGRVIHRRPSGSSVRGAASSGSSLETKALVLEGRLTETQLEIEELKRQLTLERLRSQGDAGSA